MAPKKSKSRNASNICKMCECEVTKSDGMQCKGPCKKWAHYECLGMTPGKIADIKAGIIIVSCACPNCEPSETRTDMPFTCPHKGCPINIGKTGLCSRDGCKGLGKKSKASKEPKLPKITCGIKDPKAKCDTDSETSFSTTTTGSEESSSD